MTTPLRDGWFYLPMYFQENDSSVCTLLVRHLRLVEGARGRRTLVVTTGGKDFLDEEAMTDAIAALDMNEVPEAEEQNDRWMPPGWQADRVMVRRRGSLPTVTEAIRAQADAAA
jgi:hypothetical protein